MSLENQEKNIIIENEVINHNNKYNNEYNFSYKKDLWMYFESINSKFIKERQKAKSLMYIISQKNMLAEDYANNLELLYKQFFIELSYFSETENDNIKNNKNYSLNDILNLFLEDIKLESDLFKNYSQSIKEKFLYNLEQNLKTQYEINSNLNEIMKAYENNFKKVIEKFEKIKLEYQNSCKSVEKFKKEYEILKVDIESKKEKNDIEELRYQKFKEENDERIKEAKEKQKIYEDYIIEANKERKNYIELSEKTYDLAQKLDNEYFDLIKKKLNYFFNSQSDLLNKILEENKNMIKNINLINFTYELKQFVNSKFPKFSLPKPFTYEQYNPYLVLRKRNEIDVDKSQTHEIIKNVVKEINHLFFSDKNNLNYDNNIDNINTNNKEIDSNKINSENKINLDDLDYIRESVHKIWSSNKLDDKKLFNLLKNQELRITFLRELNQYRIEGIFILEEKSYDKLVSVFNSILLNSRKEKDFECIKLCMILSQTFYKSIDDKIFLQTEVMKNDIWKKRVFWEEIIEYCIKDEINYSKGYLIFLEENEEKREERVKQVVNSNLVTYSYNMKLFNVSQKERKEIINKFIKKYDIKDFIFFDDEIDVNEIKDEILTGSLVSNIDIQPTEEKKNDEK